MNIQELYRAFEASRGKLNTFLSLVSADPSSNEAKKKYFQQFMSNFGNDSSSWKGVAGSTISTLFDAIKTQETSSLPTITEQVIKFSDAEKILISNNGELKNFGEIFNSLLTGAKDLVVNQTLLYLRTQNSLLKEINGNTSLTGQLSEDYRNEIIQTIPYLTKIGIGTDEITNATISLIKQTGRFNMLNAETWVESSKLAKAFVGDLNDMVSAYIEFEKVGIGAKDTNKYIEDASRKSLSVGLETRNVTKLIRENIGKVNEFGFKNGIDGLSQMVRKSIEFGMNMQTVTNIADKLFDLDNVVEMSANLQVLGGAIGDFIDPLKLMYMTTNDVNGLQDAVIGLTKDLVSYDEKSQTFGITGANLRIARDRAKALGMDYQEFATIAINANKRLQASMDLMNLGGDDSFKEFLTNISQMEGGELKISIPQDLRNVFNGKTEIKLKDIEKNSELIEKLKQYQDEFKNLSKDEIIQKQASNIENIERNVSFIASSLVIRGGTKVNELANKYGISLDDFKNFTNELTKKVPKTIESNKEEVNKQVTPNKINSGFESILDSSYKSNKEEKTKFNNDIIKTEVTVNIKSDTALFDSITNEFIKNPIFAKNVAEIIAKNHNEALNEYV